MQRFEEKWVAHADYEELIRTSWTETQPRGSLMYCLFEKIKKNVHMTWYSGAAMPLEI